MITVSYKDAISDKGIKQEYPCIKKHLVCARIVLFTSKGVGYCLNFDGEYGCDFMEMSTYWCEENYVLYGGSIILENKV